MVDVSAFVEKWKQSGASERANKDSFVRDLCDVLGVPHPDPATGDPDRDRYTFERDAVLLKEKHTIGKIDLYKHGCFILEAKQGSQAESKKIGSARRATPAWSVVMQEAFGQAPAVDKLPPWPAELPKQIAAVRDLVTSNGGTESAWSVERAAKAFKRARKKELESVLDSLAALGIVIAFETPEGRRWRAAV